MTTMDKVVRVEVDVKNNKIRIMHERDLFVDDVLSLGNHPTENGYVEISKTATGHLIYSHRPWGNRSAVYENYPISPKRLGKLVAEAFHVKGHERLWFNLWNKMKSQ